MFIVNNNRKSKPFCFNVSQKFFEIQI